MLGYGEIGQETARLARAFGMKVLALRRNTKLSHAEAEDGLKVLISGLKCYAIELRKVHS